MCRPAGLGGACPAACPHPPPPSRLQQGQSAAPLPVAERPAHMTAELCASQAHDSTASRASSPILIACARQDGWLPSSGGAVVSGVHDRRVYAMSHCGGQGKLPAALSHLPGPHCWRGTPPPAQTPSCHAAPATQPPPAAEVPAASLPLHIPLCLRCRPALCIRNSNHACVLRHIILHLAVALLISITYSVPYEA